MKISSKGRYALQLIIFLAQTPGFVSLNVVSQKTGISKKYLEQIVSLLTKSGLLLANRGFQGGYKNSLPPDKVTVYDVLKITESALLFDNDDNTDNFALKSVFSELNDVVSSYLKSVLIKDIIEKENERLINDYVI